MTTSKDLLRLSLGLIMIQNLVKGIKLEENDLILSSNPKKQFRQIYDMVDIVDDVAMLTLLSIPFLGLLAVGSNFFSPMINESIFNSRLAKVSNPNWFSYFQLYKKTVHLEKVLKKLKIFESECQLKAICEINKSKSNNNEAKKLINDLKSLKFELEVNEIIPISKMIVSNYAKALEEPDDCLNSFKQCPQVFKSF